MPKVITYKCDHVDKGGICEGEIQEWRLEGYEPVPTFILCERHAAEFGFCLTCGAFIGGTEDVFLTGQDGMCFDCYIQIDQELKSAYDDYYSDDHEDEL